MKNEWIQDFLDEMIEAGSLRATSTKEGDYNCTINDGKGVPKVYALRDGEFGLALNSLFFDSRQQYLTNAQVQEAIDILRVVAFRNKSEYKLCKRIYAEEEKQILYDLDGKQVVCVDESGVCLAEVDEELFRRTNTFKEQVEPDLDANPRKEYLKLVKKHFNLASEDDVKLMALYLVTAFLGLNISHSVLVLVGSKGSGKSSITKRIISLVSPQEGGMRGASPSLSDMHLNLYNNYIVACDNYSSVSKPLSDLFCIASSGGSISKRKLYENTSEIVMDVKCLVVINSVNASLIGESDLLDRSIILHLKRIPSTEFKSEIQLEKEYQKDLPRLLGCIFNILHEMLLDDEELPSHLERLRLTDMHIACVKAGRVLGISDQETTRLLLKNRRKADAELLYSEPIATCIMSYFKKKRNTYFQGSVTQFLNELKQVAYELGMSEKELPASSNAFSRKLNKLQSNLNSFANIQYEIHNTGAYRQITIEKRK